ncbi:MAG TPA: response regulator, partial [Chloroflexota bacterium]
RVLVVDDDAEMVRLLAAMVRSIAPGCRVLEACSGEAALAAIERERPELVLLDLVMPEVDGHEVIRRLQLGGGAPPPIVTISAGTPEGQHVRAEIASIGRASGLTASELISCLNGVLTALGRPAGSAPRSRPAALAG